MLKIISGGRGEDSVTSQDDDYTFYVVLIVDNGKQPLCAVPVLTKVFSVNVSEAERQIMEASSVPNSSGAVIVAEGTEQYCRNKAG